MKVLSSRYDIYQDTMNPANFPFLGGVDANWTTAGWPADIIRQANGDWRHGWAVRGTNDIMYDCGVLCDSRALDYARARIPRSLPRALTYAASLTRPRLLRGTNATTQITR
jgi:hypothetical protein